MDKITSPTQGHVGSISDTLANRLTSSGCLISSKKHVTVEIINDFLKNFTPLNYKEDLQCLQESILHYTTARLKELVLEARATMLSNGKMGRILNDNDIEESSKEITKNVLEEIGENYRQRLYLYFGNEEGVVTYIFHRVHDSVTDFCMNENKQAISRYKARRIVSENKKDTVE